jgi:hypothetical protein
LIASAPAGRPEFFPLEFFMPNRNIIPYSSEPRPHRAERAAAHAPYFSESHHETLTRFRMEALAQRGEAEIAAGTSLGLAAMQSIALNPAQTSLLRGLVNAMGAPRACRHEDCRIAGACLSAKIECYWRKREYVRAVFPQVDDALLRLATPQTSARKAKPI